MGELNDKKYTEPNRLGDVITLISVLAVHEDTFKSASGLETAIRRKPKSGFDNWVEFGKEHPEFFRLNDPNSKDGERLALVIRSYLKEIDRPDDGKKTRIPLTVEQTQKLIEYSISLHDKELARLQKNAFRIPIRVAWISGSILVLISLINAGVAIHSSNTSKIDSIKTTLDSIELRLKR